MRRKREFIQREILISYFFTCLEASYENMALYLYRQTERYLIEMSKKYENSPRFGKKKLNVWILLRESRTKKGCLQQPKALKMAQEQDILGSNTSLFPVSVGRSIPL